MSRKKKRTRTAVPISGPFLPLTFEELDSKAYQDLKGNAAKVYAYLKRAARTVACKTGAGHEGVAFDFTYTEAKRLGFSESTFHRALIQLWEVGFLDVVQRGGMRGTGRSNSKYQLITRWRTYRTQWTDRAKHEQNPLLDSPEPKKGDEKW